jgi:hypothetical protein
VEFFPVWMVAPEHPLPGRCEEIELPGSGGKENLGAGLGSNENWQAAPRHLSGRQEALR